MRRVQPADPDEASCFVVSLGEDPDEGGSREDDLRLLRALSDDGDVPDRHRDAFDDMLDRLLGGQRRLTKGQRDYAASVASEHGIDARDPAEKNRDVPRGREVGRPAALSDESLKKALHARRRAAWHDD